MTELKRVCSSAWICIRRPALLLPGFAAVTVFAVLMVIGIFASAARPGGSRLGRDPVFLTDLAGADALGYLAGGVVSIVGSCVLAVAAAHIASPFANGSVRIQLVRSPRRGIWMGGNLLVVAILSVLLTLASVVGIVAAAYGSAAMHSVPTGEWVTGPALADLATTTANLAGSMVGFAMLGALVAVWLRSAIASIGVALCYALFEQLLSGLVPSAARFLPAENLGAFATGGNDDIPYAWAVVASIVVIAGAAALAITAVKKRDVTD